MLALAVYRASLCHRCGGDLDETTNPLHDGDNPHGTHMYKRAKLIRCFRCTALLESERMHANPGPGAVPAPHPAAVDHFVELVPRGRR